MLQEIYKKHFEESFQPTHLKQFESMLIENAEGDGWFVGDGVS